MTGLNGIIIALGLFAATIVAAPASAASAPADFCAGDPCTISGTITADAGSIVDFGARSLVFAANARVEVGPGPLPRTLAFIAEDITMNPGAQIRGFSDDRANVTLQSTVGAITMLSAGSTRSEINVKADNLDAGNIILISATDAIVGGRLTASAQGEDSTGGTVDITAPGAITITEEITTEGSGTFAGGGDFFATAGGDLTVANKIFAQGSDFGGGEVSLTSTGGDVIVSALITNDGGDPDGEAGEFNIAAGGDFHITSTGEFRGKGGAGADDDCGDGAPTFIETGLSLSKGGVGNTIVGTSGSVIIDGLLDTKGGFQCFGGEVEINAGLDFVQNGSGKISTETGGGFGAAGSVVISAARSAVTRQIDASSAGFGGEVLITAGLFIDVLDKLRSKATGAEGIGSNIVLTACSVDVLAPDGELDARGPFAFPGFGKNVIRVSGPSVISGDMFAATENEIRHLGAPPLISGTIDPAVTLIPDATLLACTNSCGDASLDAPEVCDDGNISSCDGCSSDCTRLDDVCGDGLIECGEQCDDGNAIPGDGCENDCTPTGQEETGVFIEGRGKKVGCQHEWLIQVADPDTDKKGKPAPLQKCIDGDFRCDADGAINGSCSLIMQPCLNVPDDDLLECDSSSLVQRIILKKPLPGSNNAQDDANAQAMIASLQTLGATLEADGNVVAVGGPVPGATVCGPPIEVKVPFTGKSGKRTFKVRTNNEAGLILKKGEVRLKCERNDSVCGNTVVEPGETCDDGNVVSCDGCSSCRTEICGNGTVECTEQCDDGILNGAPGERCSNTCTILPAELRIPGGGSKKTDSMWQWSMDMAPGEVFVSKRGIPRNKQTCRDGDAMCDLDPTPGNCRVRVFGCAAAENTEIGCLAQSVDSVEIRRPKATSKRPHEVPVRATMDAVLGAMAFPATGGEVCSSGMELDIPQGEKLRLSVKAFGAKKDGDSLRIICE